MIVDFRKRTFQEIGIIVRPKAISLIIRHQRVEFVADCIINRVVINVGIPVSIGEGNI